jgi:hypothetical protein
MTVFVVHPIRQDDISGARKWGELRFINAGYVYGDMLENRVAVGAQYQMPEQFVHNLDAAALEFRDSDCVLIAGDHLQLLYFTGLIARRYAEFGVLRYDKKISDYIPVRLHMGLARHGGPVLPLSNIGDRSDAQDRNQGEDACNTAAQQARQSIYGDR